ncbi:Tetratricopeptide_repeat-containing protein [Hexamita inflata]|uniref:Tetratricopeptide repeat-containing protein n=1 Tax=Hexamita inflata TaxID=28002 RepID=A0AA86QJN7_9EUKA|nr:Tetratricopeptide repeat-containing protein [Hexamita inflata]CAI9950435.1 Tetratricopeptide repeat-containing protein [Hexamita inflata]CAI9960706.1 Tetratricopeptide repeat-containing protein [Hexamita inflata]
MPQKPILDSVRTEQFFPLVPHRLPLPPLLAESSPSKSNQSTTRPQQRLQLQLQASLTAVEPPLLQSDAEQFSQDNFSILSNEKVKELQTLQVTCARSQRPLAEALIFWNLAVEFENAGYHARAQQEFENFVKPCARAGYTPGILSGLSSIAVSLFLQKKYKDSIQINEQAVKLVDEALKIIQKTSGGWLTASFIMSSLSYNIGLNFLELFDYEAATLAFSRSLQHGMQTQNRLAEASVNAAQAVCNSLSGDFEKVDSCLDRFVELYQVEETGLETTLGLRSVQIVKENEIFNLQNNQQSQASKVLVFVLIKIANYARFHKNLVKSRHYAARAFNIARQFGFYGLVNTAACIMGIADGEQFNDTQEIQLEVIEVEKEELEGVTWA